MELGIEGPKEIIDGESKPCVLCQGALQNCKVLCAEPLCTFLSTEGYQQQFIDLMVSLPTSVLVRSHSVHVHLRKVLR
jgi:hypothetical protein